METNCELIVKSEKVEIFEIRLDLLCGDWVIAVGAGGKTLDNFYGNSREKLEQELRAEGWLIPEGDWPSNVITPDCLLPTIRGWALELLHQAEFDNQAIFDSKRNQLEQE